jgi:hypothetical protein
VGTYAYVNPVVAVGLGTIFLGESLSLRTVVAAAVILVAVAIIVTARGRLQRTEPPADDPAGAIPRPSAATATGSASASAPSS